MICRHRSAAYWSARRPAAAPIRAIMCHWARGFVAFIPTGRAINPVTGTNWEHVGVKPDIAVPAASAMKTAYAAILKDLAGKATDPRDREGLAATLASVEKDEIQLPVYTPRR